MADVYKLLADIICASIDTEWEKGVIIKSCGRVN